MMGLSTQSTQQVLVGQRLTDTSAVRTKVEQDIAFLTSRIHSMEQHPRPNSIVLDTYKGMLKSRTSVLKWLIHGSVDDDSSIDFVTQRIA